MKSLFLILFLFQGFSLLDQTYVPNLSEVSGTWDKKGSPYVIDGEAIVPEGELLIIKSGTVVKFRTCEVHDMEKEGFSCGFLRVNGTILAEGKKSVMPQEGSLSMAPQVESQIA